MRARRYPLAPLQRLRAKGVEDATKLLSDAIRAKQAAEESEVDALERRDGAAERARLLIEGEKAALDRGELRSADLALAAAWRKKDEAERTVLERRLEAASEDRESAVAEAEGAVGAVAKAHAEAQVVARDRARWESARQKREATVEEERAADSYRGAKK